ncbi:MAG: hypothetical protein IIU77_05840 [Clostridia bacterium]|nr:hypothetical protein [Clostridia bacterium]
MKPEEFESYVRKGLGRAITLLKEEENKEPYRKLLVDMLTDDNLSGRFWGEYEKELIDCFDDRDDVAREIAEVCLATMESGEISLINIYLLVLLGYRDAVIELAERRYRKSYAELLELAKRGDSDEKHPPCAGEYFGAASALARCKVDSSRMKQILIDMADLYRYSECPVVPEYQNPLYVIRDGYGEALSPLANAVIAEHPYGSKFEKHVPRPSQFPPEPLDNITAEDILASERFGGNYARLHVSFMNADESVVRAVAERILSEPDRKRQLHLLTFFTPMISPETVPLVFPLDPTPLVETVIELEPVMYSESSSHYNEATRYLDALMFMRHPSVKSLAKRMLENKECPAHIRNYALQMFYGANYTPEDCEAFTELLLSESSPDRAMLFHVYTYLISRKTPDIPLDLIPYVFGACRDPWLRHLFVKALIKADALTDEIKAECTLDASKFTRRLVAEL